MIETLVAGFILTGSVCILDGEQHRDCRSVPALRFGNQYSCDERVQTILASFPYAAPEELGYTRGQRLRVQVKCIASRPGA